MRNNYCRVVEYNGIRFGTSYYDQAYFDRKRNARRRKKLGVGDYLVLVANYLMKVRESDLVERFGNDFHCNFAFEDAVVDLSYLDKECTVLNQDCWLALMTGARRDAEGYYRYVTCWEVSAPDAYSYMRHLDEIEKKLSGLVQHEGSVLEIPLFLHG